MPHSSQGRRPPIGRRLEHAGPAIGVPGAESEKTRSTSPLGPTANVAAILLAGGRGSRMRGVVGDKVLVPLAGRPVFAWSLAALVETGVVDRFIVVYRDAAQRAKLAAIYERSSAREWPVRWVRGGVERQHSVMNALETVSANVTHVHIHDCARPLVHPDALRALASALLRDGAACLAHRVVDTIKRVPAPATDTVKRRLRTIERSQLWAMETPQSFARPLITEAYRAVHRRKQAITDDASALEIATRRGVTLVENPQPNPKITSPADLASAEFLLGQRLAVRAQQPTSKPRKRPSQR